MTNEDKAVVVEGSKSVAVGIEKRMNIIGLEEIPTNLIPVPFYKLVQPGSTGVALASGEEASPGTIFMSDTGETVDRLRFLILRAKRQHREFMDDGGQPRMSTTIAVLGMNLARMTPFVLNVAVSSFTSFGRLMAQFKEIKAEHAWDYAVVATTEKIETLKETTRGQQMVKYWIFNFQLEKDLLSKDDIELAEAAFREYGSSLDRRNEDEEEKVVKEGEELVPESVPF